MMHEDDDCNYWWDAKHTIPVEMKKGGGAVIPVEMKKGGGAVPREQKKVGEEEIVGAKKGWRAGQKEPGCSCAPDVCCDLCSPVANAAR